MKARIRIRRSNLEKFPGASPAHFKFLFKKAKEVMRHVDYPKQASPYSIVPLMMQVIGLEVPMMGTGRSPYSIISYISNLDQANLFKYDAALSIPKRRELIDEVYEMISPYLLHEQANYIDLVIATRYKDALRNFSALDIKKFRTHLNKKFAILDDFFSRMKFSGGDFSHIVHYGYYEDLIREQGFLKDFDKETAKLWRDNSYPVVIEMRMDGYNAPNKSTVGWFIFVPNYTEELLQNKALRQKKLLQAGLLAKRLGSKFSGMAGLIASFSKGGKFLSENISNFGFTTGHSFTIANLYAIMQNIAKKLSLDLSKSKVAIIGAAGSIGSGVSKLISENSIKEIILIDRPNMISSNKLIKLANKLRQSNPSNVVVVSKTISDIKDADLIIIATNSPTSIVDSKYLKPGVVVIDDSFPKNVSRDILEKRDDIILLEGGVAQMPRLDVDVSRQMPDLMDVSVSKLVSCSQAYGCLAETFILAAFGHIGNYGLGDSDPLLAKDIMDKAKKLKVKQAVFQSYGFTVGESRIERVKNLIKDRTE